MILHYLKLNCKTYYSLFRVILFHSIFSSAKCLLFIFFLVGSSVYSQTAATRIYTDWNGYWTSNAATTTGNQPNTENNLLAFTWNNVIYSTGVNDATLTTKGVGYDAQVFRALKIQSLSYGSSTYFIQAAMMDGSLTDRTLIPAIAGSVSTPAELASRLTDGLNGLSLGTGIANIASATASFKIGTDNISSFGIGDGVPDIVVSQVAQPSSAADTFKFIDATGNTVGTAVTVAFNGIQVVGTYRLDLFNANNGLASSSFSANENRDIRLLAMDLSAFGITAANAASVDRFVVNFSGSSDCAFIAFNRGSLKTAELSLVNKASMAGCGAVGDKINYSFEVTNTGQSSITNIVVNDSMTGIVMTTNTIACLAVGETKTVNAVYTITAADVAAGKVVNSATVSGIDPSLNTVSDVSGQTNSDDIDTVVSFLTPPKLGTITQPTCVTPTGSVVLNGLPSSGTWTLTQSGGSSIPTTTTGSGTSTTISGLAVGSYTFTVSTVTCSSTASNVVNINAAIIPINQWDGCSWSLGTPNSNQKLVFNGLYSSTTDNLNGCSCEVKPGVTVNINSGLTLNLVNELKVASTATMTFFDTSSLVQQNGVENGVVNDGDIDYQRTTTSVRASDYVYWSSPVSNQDIGTISLAIANGTYYYYDPISKWKRVYSGATMTIGTGYIVRRPDYASGIPVVPGTYTASFVGVPNNGNQMVYSILAGKSYLLGNPYPSAISADAFLAANSGVLNGTLYFWTHNTAIQDRNNISSTAGTGANAYTSNDYASYNSTGGVATAAISDVSASVKPNGYIAAGQGFFATARDSGSLTFTNAMRVGGTTLGDGTGANQQFFKTKNSKTQKVVEKSRIWLNLTNTGGAFKQTLVGYLNGATNAIDNLYDGESLDGNDFIDFYSVNSDKNLSIQGRSLPFDENDEVPLGYSSTIKGDFTISIDEVDGSLTNQAVYIEDKLANTTFDLKNGNYTFSTAIGTFNDRFVLRYTDKTLGTNDFSTTQNKVVVAVKNKQITVNAFAETIKKVAIYDLLGREIYQKDKVNSNSLSLSNLNLSHQTLIVKTSLQNGSTQTDKIVF